MTTPCPNRSHLAKTCPPDCPMCGGFNLVHVVTAAEMIAELWFRQRSTVTVRELVSLLGELTTKQQDGE